MSERIRKQVRPCGASRYSVTIGFGLLWVALGLCSGCITYAKNTIPANRLPCEFRAEAKKECVPINFALLRQAPPPSHVIGPRDVLSVYVYGVLPAETTGTPIIQQDQFRAQDYYPPFGSNVGPALGVPITVSADGQIRVPLIDPLPVEGLTLQQAADALVAAYAAKGVVQKGRERVVVSLLKARVHRVMVVREDSNVPLQFRIKEQVEAAHRGSAAMVDLPAHQNDVLHALVATGGLPGEDATNRLWILRGGKYDPNVVKASIQMTEEGEVPEFLVEDIDTTHTRTCIPLKIAAGETPSFTNRDVILNEGDILFVEPRGEDYFYTGGLIRAGQVPLPRDQDIDILEAVAIANSAVGGPAKGQSGGQNVVTQGAGTGNILVPPTRAIVVRKLADGREIRIRVDLNKAVHDSKERILIQPEDLIMLQFKPGQQVSNTILNFFNWNVTLLPTGF